MPAVLALSDSIALLTLSIACHGFALTVEFATTLTTAAVNNPRRKLFVAGIGGIANGDYDTIRRISGPLLSQD
jgi:hypothetical protein